MIKDERQYTVTRAEADEVRVALCELETAPFPEGVSPEMREVQVEALEGMLGDLEAELANFDALRNAEREDAKPRKLGFVALGRSTSGSSAAAADEILADGFGRD